MAGFNIAIPIVQNVARHNQTTNHQTSGDTFSSTSHKGIGIAETRQIRFGEKFTTQELRETTDRILGLNGFVGIGNNRRMTHSLLVALTTPPDVYPSHSIPQHTSLRLSVISSLRTAERFYMDKKQFFALVKLAEICTKNLQGDSLQTLVRAFQVPISDGADLRRKLEFLKSTDIEQTDHPAEGILAIYAVARNEKRMPEFVNKLCELLPDDEANIRSLQRDLERIPSK